MEEASVAAIVGAGDTAAGAQADTVVGMAGAGEAGTDRRSALASGVIVGRIRIQAIMDGPTIATPGERRRTIRVWPMINPDRGADLRPRCSGEVVSSSPGRLHWLSA